MKKLSGSIPLNPRKIIWLIKKRGAIDFFLDAFYNIFIRKNNVPYYLNRASTIINSGNLFIQSDSLSTIISLSVSPGVYIQCNNGVYIGNNVLIAPYVKIVSSNHSKDAKRSWIKTMPIVLEDDIWIGTSAIILPGVTISKGITIGAGSVVTKSLKGESQTYVGNPARIVK